MRPVYDSARRQGYYVWNKRLVMLQFESVQGVCSKRAV